MLSGESILPYCDLSPQGLSLWGLFMQADWVVKCIILSLLAASFWSWSIMFSKSMALRSLHKAAARLKNKGIHLDSWDARVHSWDSVSEEPFSQLIDMASSEFHRHSKPNGKNKDREWHMQCLEQTMSIRIDQQREALSKNMGVLASVGSMAPFIGLFGTVWGIMNSFQCIAVSKNTSLAVVAPGIAEALFATAIGLIVAIPAVIAYNRLTLAINSYIVGLENFAQELILKCFHSTETHL